MTAGVKLVVGVATAGLAVVMVVGFGAISTAILYRKRGEYLSMISDLSVNNLSIQKVKVQRRCQVVESQYMLFQTT